MGAVLEKIVGPNMVIWRDSLSDSERAKLNHPKRFLDGLSGGHRTAGGADAKRTERAMREPKPNPMLDAVADAEAETLGREMGPFDAAA
jgi:hypothetical protein